MVAPEAHLNSSKAPTTLEKLRIYDETQKVQSGNIAKKRIEKSEISKLLIERDVNFC